jgi:hypothetical protein
VILFSRDSAPAYNQIMSIYWLTSVWKKKKEWQYDSLCLSNWRFLMLLGGHLVGIRGGRMENASFCWLALVTLLRTWRQNGRINNLGSNCWFLSGQEYCQPLGNVKN